MNDDSKIEFFEEKNKDINFKLIKKENIILFLNFFILFCFINLFLYLYLYKTTWPVPHFFSFILLNYPLLFMAWGCFLFFIHPSIILSKIVKIRYETIYIQNEKFFSENKTLILCKEISKNDILDKKIVKTYGISNEKIDFKEGRSYSKLRPRHVSGMFFKAKKFIEETIRTILKLLFLRTKTSPRTSSTSIN